MHGIAGMEEVTFVFVEAAAGAGCSGLDDSVVMTVVADDNVVVGTGRRVLLLIAGGIGLQAANSAITRGSLAC